MTAQTVQTAQAKAVDLSFMADKWPSAIVSRNNIEKFTGGLITGNGLKNQDKGLTRIRRNQRVFYMVSELIPWLEKDCYVVQGEQKTPQQLLEEKFDREAEVKEKKKATSKKKPN